MLLDTCNPQLVSPAYTPESVWHNRDHFFVGTANIEAFLTEKWAKENHYRLKKELFAFDGNRMFALVRHYRQKVTDHVQVLLSSGMNTQKRMIRRASGSGPMVLSTGYTRRMEGCGAGRCAFRPITTESV
jgi:hypothetical protein